MKLFLALLLCTAPLCTAQEQPCTVLPEPYPISVSFDARASAQPSSSGAAAPIVLTAMAAGAVQAVDAATAQPLWRFEPPEAQPGSGLGSFSDIRVLHFDANQDGVIDAAGGDRVWAYLGLRRHGAVYYALDLSERNRVRVLWRRGADALPGLAEAWSAPTLARVRIAGAAQNAEHLVVWVGGGYDPQQQGGNRIFMLDAASGALLWHAGGAGASGPDLYLPHMRHAIAARIGVLDTDNDRFADRLYTADTGGQIWRFDISNGQPRATLVAGGVLAELGAAATSPDGPLSVDSRAFFSAPDVALIQSAARPPYFSLALGSGDPARLLDRTVRQRFYLLRDRAAFTPMSQAQYAALSIVRDSALPTVTADENASVPSGSPGWKLELGGVQRPGEKVLAEALTANGVVMFTSFTPLDSGCPPRGLNRVYALRVEHARPALDFNDDGIVDHRDAAVELGQTGIAGEVRLLLPPRSDPGGTEPTTGWPDPPLPGEYSVCLVGSERLPRCVSTRPQVRTFWKRTRIE